MTIMYVAWDYGIDTVGLIDFFFFMTAPGFMETRSCVHVSITILELGQIFIIMRCHPIIFSTSKKLYVPIEPTQPKGILMQLRYLYLFLFLKTFLKFLKSCVYMACTPCLYHNMYP